MLKVKARLVSDPTKEVHGTNGAQGAEGKAFIDGQEVIEDTIQVQLDNGEWVGNDAYAVYVKTLPVSNIIEVTEVDEEVED